MSVHSARLLNKVFTLLAKTFRVCPKQKQPKHFSNFKKTYFTGSRRVIIYVKIRDEEYKCDVMA